MNRRAHTIATTGLTGLLVSAGFTWPEAWLVAGGAAAGIVLTPDLDSSDTPYGWTHRHRGLSHVPVLGTVERLLWFAGPAVAAWLAAGYSLEPDLLWVLAGLCLADGLHLLLDKLG